MNPDFCFTKILINQVVFDHEKNLNNNKQTKTCKNSSPIKLVKIRFRNFGIGSSGSSEARYILETNYIIIISN